MTVLLEEMVLYLAKVHAVEKVVNINFVNCGLTDVSIVQRMAQLEIASLSVNELTSMAVFAGCTTLKKLFLRSNKIEDINEVQHIKNLLHLEELALEGNPCVKTAGPGYRGILLRTLPTLKVIDTTRVTEQEIKNALRNSNCSPPVMHDEHNEESSNPFAAHHQSAQQSASPHEEQLVQVSPRPRTPFTAGHQEQEQSPDPPGTPPMGLGLEQGRGCSPADSAFGSNISRENCRETGPACMAPSASVQPARDYRSQVLDFGQNSMDFEQQMQQLRLQQMQQLRLQQLQLQLQLGQQQPPLPSYGNGGLEMVPQQSYRSYPGQGQSNTNAPVASPQRQTGNCENCRFGNEPQQGHNMRRRGQPVHNNNNLSAIIYLLQELDLAALQQLDAAVSRRLRDHMRD